MRSAHRGVVAAAAATGLVASSFLLTLPAGATPPPAVKSTLKLTATSPFIGGSCVLGATLRTSTGQKADERVEIQRAVGKSWVTVTAVTSKKSGTANASYPTYEKTYYRAHFVATDAVQQSFSPTVACSPKALSSGVRSPGVRVVQNKLQALRIRPASTSGTFDYNTLEAVWAFQKAKGLPRTGVVTVAVYKDILATKALAAPSWCTAADKICVDISQQDAYLKIGSVRWVIPVSTAGGYYFYDPQSKQREFAHTPRGVFHVYYKVPGATNGPLGTYYWISFFTGGYGIHGEGYVPSFPVSHGCVREPRPIEQWVYNNLPIGAQVHVHD